MNPPEKPCAAIATRAGHRDTTRSSKLHYSVKNMPTVSIILPTYNRADTIVRAINSVIAQTYQDWELLIVDDGSTDGTADLVRVIDPRIRVLQQENAGVYVARNTGLQAGRGEYFAFLDSDDEWLPHFLEITIAFLRWSPDDHFVATEFFQDWGPHVRVRHDYQMVTRHHLKRARLIGSTALALPPGENDDYLRIYSEKVPVGSWGKSIAERADYPEAALYRGNIFEHMRWGYLNWLPAIVISRTALMQVGSFRENFRNGADFHFLALLARNFRTNMIGIPSAFKHETSGDFSQLKEGHLAGGSNSYRFEAAQLQFFGELFYSVNPDDRELQLINRLNHLSAGRAALQSGQCTVAKQHLKVAALWRAELRKAYLLLALIYLHLSSDRAATTYMLILRIRALAHRLRDRGRRLFGFTQETQ